VSAVLTALLERGIVDQQALVERARRGDHEAFRLLIGARLARLDTAARLILGDAELARDAVQDATMVAETSRTRGSDRMRYLAISRGARFSEACRGA